MTCCNSATIEKKVKKVVDTSRNPCRMVNVVIDTKEIVLKEVITNFVSDLMSLVALLGFCMIFSGSFFVAIAKFFGWSI